MAEIKTIVTVSAEAVIHSGLRMFAEEMLKQYGVRLDRVDFAWTSNVTINGKDTAILRDVAVSTVSVGPVHPGGAA